MTNYIEEMMRTAGVEKKCDIECEHKIQKYCSENDICRDTYFKPFPLCVGFDNCKKEYKEKDKYYPDFTPEKQLEIIKLICSNSINDKYKYFSMDKDEITEDWFIRCTINDDTYEASNAVFSQALAQLATELMKAGELDKEKVKEVLQ